MKKTIQITLLTIFVTLVTASFSYANTALPEVIVSPSFTWAA